MERTELFVGMYHNKTYIRPDEKVETYNMSLAYILAIGACFVISLNLTFIVIFRAGWRGLYSLLGCIITRRTSDLMRR